MWINTNLSVQSSKKDYKVFLTTLVVKHFHDCWYLFLQHELDLSYQSLDTSR